LHAIEQFVTNFNPQFKDLPVADRKKWGGRVLGAKANVKIEKLRKAKAREAGFSQ
jgi:hypothetical protein